MYDEFYGFREPPFNITPDPRFLFFSDKHREAIVPITRRRRLEACAVPCLCLALFSGRAWGQANDNSFKPSVGHPTYAPYAGPRLLIDEAHRNLHTATGRYAAFAAVASRDGFRVERSTSPFSTAPPPPGVILVIANARGADKDADAAFGPAEIRNLRSGVESGGSLFLIADHAPFGSASKNLAEAFGVEIIDGNVRDAEHQARELPGPDFLEFTRANGLLNGNHAITNGRGTDETVKRVVTFGGLALRGGPGSAVLLRLGAKAESVLDPDNPDSAIEPVGGLSQAIALEPKSGRVLIVGEAGLFGAQRIGGKAARKAGLQGELRFGMNHPGTDDEQFLLNALHWLGRRL